MIIQQKQGGQGLGNLGGLGQPSELTVDDLLRAAVLEGGAVGETAERLMNPKRGFFSTLTGATMSTLNGFITAIQTPSYVVAGMLDPTRTISETVKGRLTPGDVLMQNKPSKYDPFINRAGYQVAKFGVDTLLDPLTYVTFGASRGILGLSKGADAYAGAKLAEQLGTKEGMRVYLSEAGEDLADKYLKAKRNGLRQTFLKNERVKMVNQGLDNETITKRLADLENGVDDHLIKEVFESSLSKRDASQAVANLIEKYPHLAKEFIDKGGVKFFGKSILEGQRIRAVKALIPGTSLLDRATQPIRGYLGNMFSTKYMNGERLTDEYVDLNQQWKNIYEAHRDRLSINGVRLKQQLGLTSEEWEFITAAVETGMKPSDPKAADVYTLLHGVPPKNGTIRNEVWQGFLGVKKMNDLARNQLVEAGLPVKDLPNYMPHMLVKENIANVPFKPGTLKQNTNRNKFAKLSVLEDENGIRQPVKILGKPDADGNVQIVKIVNGEEVVQDFKFISESRELKRVGDTYKKQSEKIQTALKEVVDNIKASTSAIKTGVASKLVDDVTRMLDGIPDIDPKDKQMLVDEIVKFVKDDDVDKIVSGRLARFYKNGVKFSNGQRISKPDLDKLATDIVMAKGEATSVVSRINKLLAKDIKLPHQKKSMPADKVVMDKEIAELAQKMKDEAAAIKQKTFARKLDDNKVTELLQQVVARTSKNPKGLNQVIDRLISNKQLAAELKEELADITRAFNIEKEEIIDGAGKYVDEYGKSFERMRARIQEINDSGFKEMFEDNALVLSTLAADDAIKVSTARHFTKEVAERFGRPASTAPDHYVPVEKMNMEYEGQDLSKWLVSKDGEPILFEPSIAKHIQDMSTSVIRDEGSNQVLRAYDAIQNYFKAAVTSIFPAFHGRNALSNVFLMYNRIGLEALRPDSHAIAANLLTMQAKTNALQKKMIKGTADAKEMTELMSKTVFTDKTGYKWTWAEMRHELIDNVVAFHHKNLGQTDQYKFGVNEVAEAARSMFPTTRAGKAMQKISPVNPFNPDNAIFKTGFKVGQVIEDYSRTLMFISVLRKTGDPMLASRQVKLALFDYSNLTKFEKSFMRRIVPFYSFSRKNLELQVNTLLTTPGRTAQQIRAVESLGDYFSQEDLSDEELAKLPEWAQKGYNVVTNREGSHITLLRTLGTPLEELFNRGDAGENIGMISPLIKLPLELGLDYSFFHGKPISEATQADAYQFAPEYIQKFIGYTEVEYTDSRGEKQVYHTSFAPWRMHMINNLQPIGRIFSEANRIEKAPDPSSKMNALFFGFGTREFDLEREEMKRIKENERALQDLLQQAGIGYTFTRYVPEPTKDLGELDSLE